MCYIRKLAYERYRLDWLEQHGYSIDELLEELAEKKIVLEELLDEWETTRLDSERWNGYEDFLKDEFRDEPFMMRVLTHVEYQIYMYEKYGTTKIGE